MRSHPGQCQETTAQRPVPYAHNLWAARRIASNCTHTIFPRPLRSRHRHPKADKPGLLQRAHRKGDDPSAHLIPMVSPSCVSCVAEGLVVSAAIFFWRRIQWPFLRKSVTQNLPLWSQTKDEKRNPNSQWSRNVLYHKRSCLCHPVTST